MSRRIAAPLAALAAALLTLTGCGPLVGVNVFVVGERTSLEKQVLGTYKSLNADFESYGSVRGVDPDGALRQPPPVTDSKSAAIHALQNRAYNRDDIEDFLRKGFVGEGNRGILILQDATLAREEADRQAFIRALVAEENKDRETLMQRLIDTTPGIAPEDADRVRALYASLNRDQAPAGSLTQGEDGSWLVK